MKTVILCGGQGTRLSEETTIRPKPMVQIGSKPMLWHILNLYSHFGFNEFVLALGYKAEMIKEYFLNYQALNSDLCVDLSTGNISYQKTAKEDWTVHLIDTGENTLTGGRLLRLESQLRPHGTFLLTYGDGLTNADIHKIVQFHKQHGKLATITAVRPAARFGTMQFEETRVTRFKEKVQSGEGWINGGFFVFEPGIFEHLQDGDKTILEGSPLERLAQDGQLMAYQHEGYWQCMDTIRDRQLLDELWKTGDAPWKLWDRANNF